MHQTKFGVPLMLLALFQTAASGDLARYCQTLHYVPDPPKEGMVTRLISSFKSREMVLVGNGNDRGLCGNLTKVETLSNAETLSLNIRGVLD
jgi:hypothetical protein